MFSESAERRPAHAKWYCIYLRKWHCFVKCTYLLL